MHIHDWSIKKKLLLSHFLMIGIPVFIVMVVILGILFSFLMATGSQNQRFYPETTTHPFRDICCS